MKSKLLAIVYSEQWKDLQYGFNGISSIIAGLPAAVDIFLKLPTAHFFRKEHTLHPPRFEAVTKLVIRECKPIVPRRKDFEQKIDYYGNKDPLEYSK